MTAPLPWSKFFWDDYAADPALKMCSFAAQGLWMRMLCIAAKHDPVGYVAVNGYALDQVSLARVTGGGREEVAELLEELKRNGVCKVDRRGWMYSKRIVNDAKRRAKASKFGKEGAAVRYGNSEENSETPKGTQKPTPKPTPSPRGQKPEIPVDKSTAHPDPEKLLFDLGLLVLTGSGVKAERARSLIGKWRKGSGDAPVLSALSAAQEQHISEPIAWIEQRLAVRAAAATPGEKTLAQQIIEEEERRLAREGAR